MVFGVQNAWIDFSVKWYYFEKTPARKHTHTAAAFSMHAVASLDFPTLEVQRPE